MFNKQLRILRNENLLNFEWIEQHKIRKQFLGDVDLTDQTFRARKP